MGGMVDGSGSGRQEEDEDENGGGEDSGGDGDGSGAPEAPTPPTSVFSRASEALRDAMGKLDVGLRGAPASSGSDEAAPPSSSAAAAPPPPPRPPSLPLPTGRDGRPLRVKTGREGEKTTEGEGGKREREDAGEQEPPPPPPASGGGGGGGGGRGVAGAASVLAPPPPPLPPPAAPVLPGLAAALPPPAPHHRGPLRPRPIAFVGNDWRCGPLPLFLRAAASGRGPGARAPCGKEGGGAALAAAAEAAAGGGEKRDENDASAAGEAYAAALSSSLSRARVAFCIHNLAYQGVFPAGAAPRLCLEPADAGPLWWRERGGGGGAEEAEGEDGDEASRGQGCSRDTCPQPRRETRRIPPALLMNWMRAALAASDLLLTVSPTYAREITGTAGTSGGGGGGGDPGCGLGPLLSSRGVLGIVNGLDTHEWDPASDALLPESARFPADGIGEAEAEGGGGGGEGGGAKKEAGSDGAATSAEASNAAATAAAASSAESRRRRSSGKAAAKAAFQAAHGLRSDPEAVLVGYIGRLTDQKGVDVLLSAAPALVGSGSSSPPCSRPPSGAPFRFDDLAVASPPPAPASLSGKPAPRIQLAALGAGEAWMQEALRDLSLSHPGRAVGLPDFSERAAHLLAAAADVLLVPSRFEPCGLVARAAARYGALPVVADTGGLADLVAAGGGVSMGSVGLSGDAKAKASAVRALVETVTALAAEAAGGGSLGGPCPEAASGGGGGDGSDGDGDDASSSKRPGLLLAPPSPSSWDRRLDRAAAVDFSWDVPAREWELALRGLLAAERWKWWE